MWLKDSNGNWFMSNIEAISENHKNSNVWDKDSKGDWFLKKETTSFDKVKNFTLVTGKAMSMAC